MNKYACIDFDKCLPSECGDRSGTCAAALACTRKVLEQEDPADSPVLLSMRLCVGCGDCVRACSIGAIEIKSGS
jgi:translation initiation factor RLI1